MLAVIMLLPILPTRVDAAKEDMIHTKKFEDIGKGNLYGLKYTQNISAPLRDMLSEARAINVETADFNKETKYIGKSVYDTEGWNTLDILTVSIDSNNRLGFYEVRYKTGISVSHGVTLYRRDDEVGDYGNKINEITYNEDTYTLNNQPFVELYIYSILTNYKSKDSTYINDESGGIHISVKDAIVMIANSKSFFGDLVEYYNNNIGSDVNYVKTYQDAIKEVGYKTYNIVRDVNLTKDAFIAMVQNEELKSGDGLSEEFVDLMEIVVNITKQDQQEGIENNSNEATSNVKSEAQSANLEEFSKAIVALYGPEEPESPLDTYTDPVALKDNTSPDIAPYKLELFAMANAWKPDEDNNHLDSYYKFDPSAFIEERAAVGDVFQPEVVNNETITSVIESVNTQPTGTDDLIEFMSTCYERAVYWRNLSCHTTDSQEYAVLSEHISLFQQYTNIAKRYMYLSSDVANPALNSSTNITPVKNFEAYVRYIEVIHEIGAYIEKSLPEIQEAKKNNTRISEWYKALDSLNKLVQYVDIQSVTAVFNNNFLPLYNDFKKLAEDDNNGEVGDFSDEAEKLQAGDPLQMFFNDIQSERLSDDMIKGISYSAAFVPMRTNMYDPYTTKDWDDQFLNNFHYKYGYYRKALYKAEASDAAASLQNTGLTGSTSVCTLADLIDPAGDIVLYIDDNFYNVDKLAELLDKSYDRITNTGDGDYKEDADGDGEKDGVIEKFWTQMTDNVSELLDLDIGTQTKTGDTTQYSVKLRNRVASQKNSEYYPKAGRVDESNAQQDVEKTDNEDGVVLTSGQINMYLSMTSNEDIGNGNAAEVYDDYNVLQPYSVVSSIYRSSNLFNLANNSRLREPVFIASNTVPNANNATQLERNEIFNWLLLKNLESQMPIGYSTSLDMEAPVYMDIYGNILTESGTVVVPSACNSTLFTENYHMYGHTMGMLYVYGRDYQLDTDKVQPVLESTLGARMEVDDYLGTYKMRSDVFKYEDEVGTLMDTARISIADDSVKQMMQNIFYRYMYSNDEITSPNIEASSAGYDFYKFSNIIMEVMRGAPIESINKEFENLNTARTMTNAGLSAAAKLEVLDNSLTSNNANTLLAMPNLAFVDGFEYIAMFTFKAMMLIVMLVLMFTLYKDMIGQQLSVRTLVKCISVVVITCLAVVTIPEVFDISYYQANKMFLQSETEYIAMLNEEKRQNGVEIGVTDVTEPDMSTKLLLKLTDLNVPWYDLFQDIMLANTYEGLSEVYAKFAENSPISQQQDVEIMNDGVYVYIDDLFDSVSIDIDPETGILNIRTDEVTTAAFYTPFYVILEALIADINTYNELNSWKGYTTTLQSGGRLKSIGACQGYFTDKVFMQSDGDILHMHEVYGVSDELSTYRVWTDEDVALMQKCAWACGSPNDYNRLYKVSDRARTFVQKNNNMLGKISDETFLKVMALDIAMYHNSIFGVPSCNAIEIEQLSQDDLSRLMLGTREEAMYNSSLSYGRYVYQIGGPFAVYLAAAFQLIMFALGYVKPILSFAIMASIFISLFVFKVVLRKSTSSIYGYVVTTILLCVCNFGHAGALKLCMYLPTLGLSPSICIILCTVIQLLYVVCLASVAYVSLKDWRDLGWARYQYKASQMDVGANELIAKFKYKIHMRGSNKEKVKMRDVMTMKKNEDGGMKMYDSLTDRRDRRKKRYGIG